MKIIYKYRKQIIYKSVCNDLKILVNIMKLSNEKTMDVFKKCYPLSGIVGCAMLLLTTVVLIRNGFKIFI